MSSHVEPRPQPTDQPHTVGLRVLVPLDESLQAERALLYARAVVRATGGLLLLVRASGVENAAG